MPFDIGQRGEIDKDIHIRVVETIISVFEKGEWVADLDVLALYEPTLSSYRFVDRFTDLSCNCGNTDRRKQLQRLTSIDNWAELINAPNDLGDEHAGVVRAGKNPLTRLATACVAVQKGLRTVILQQEVCWAHSCEIQWRNSSKPSRNSDSLSDIDSSAMSRVEQDDIRDDGVSSMSSDDGDDDDDENNSDIDRDNDISNVVSQRGHESDDWYTRENDSGDDSDSVHTVVGHLVSESLWPQVFIY